jgi:integrase
MRAREAVAALAGLRTTEILRLDWSAIKWEHSVIAVRASVARKVRISRHAPLAPALCSWLAPFRGMTGRLIAWCDEGAALSALCREIYRIEGKTGLVWKKNALRHSFASYRIRILFFCGKLDLKPRLTHSI